MKLLKTDNPYLTKQQWKKIFLAFSIMIAVLYTAAMIASLCGSSYFILQFQNSQLDKIESFMTAHKIQPLINFAFYTLEFCIILSFVIKRFPKWYYVLAFYGIRVILAFIVKLPGIFTTLYPFLFYLTIPIIEQCIDNHKSEQPKKFSFKQYLFCVLRLGIAVALTYVLQVIIYAIKEGNFSFQNNTMSLSTHFIYAIEYDIALSVILFTILLHTYREKGDSKLWTTYHTAGGFSQTSKKQSQKSSLKNLTKTQRHKIRLLYVKFYATQLGAFLLLMVVPFLLGKVIEFLTMYTAFAITRYILGFNYSLHYKKESLCITVGIIVFGILALAVPFFYVTLIIALTLGIGLAVLLHLSYKYKGMYLFNKIAKPDKFAELYVLMDGDLSPHHVEVICKHKRLNEDQVKLMLLFAEGNKKAYIATKLGYEYKTIERKINECLDLLNTNS